MIIITTTTTTIIIIIIKIMINNKAPYLPNVDAKSATQQN